MDDMQYSISFLLLRVENRLIHYSYEKVGVSGFSWLVSFLLSV